MFEPHALKTSNVMVLLWPGAKVPILTDAIAAPPEPTVPGKESGSWSILCAVGVPLTKG